MKKINKSFQTQLLDLLTTDYHRLFSKRVKEGIRARKEKMGVKIQAFGKQVSRDRAYQIIINDKVCNICHAQNTEVLEDLLMMGWESLENWSDKELERCIDGLSIENQPKGKI